MKGQSWHEYDLNNGASFMAQATVSDEGGAVRVTYYPANDLGDGRGITSSSITLEKRDYNAQYNLGCAKTWIARVLGLESTSETVEWCDYTLFSMGMPKRR